MAFRGTLITCTVIITINVSDVTSIKCFKCAVTAEILPIGYQQNFTPSCSYFDGSPKYIFDCPYSTMCSRIVSTIYLQDGYEQKTTTLGCAQQKLIRHVLYKGKWKEEHSVQEIYSDDCKMMKENNLVGAAMTYCYCRGDLCNSANNKFVFINVYIYLLPFLILTTIIWVKLMLRF